MHGVNSAGTVVNDILGVFGIRGAGIGLAIDSLTGNRLGQLSNLYDMYLETALGRGSGPIQRRLMGGWAAVPPFMAMPSPMSMYPMMMPLCGAGYAGCERMDLAAGSTNIPVLSWMFSGRRRGAAQFERLLRSNPYARAAFEAQIGGRIVDFGIRTDGVMRVQRFAPGFAGVPGMNYMNPLAGNALGYFASMNHAVMGQAAMMGGMGMGMPFMGAGGMWGANPFQPFLASGFSRFGMDGPAGPGWGPLDNSGPMGGRGWGSWNPNAAPGVINNTNPYYESAHQAEVSGILADPSLTVEDKVTLMIMLIMKKMDDDIMRQAEYINSIQQQQSRRGGPGGPDQGQGTGAGGTGGWFGGLFGNNAGATGPMGPASNIQNSSPSIDVETMKLKRLIDKRSQMFDMLRQIIDKYNQTAKGIIDSIGR